MTPPMKVMKLGKKVEDVRSDNCLDRISSLPDEVLPHLLSFLPTTCAVRTSILSTRWRYLFTSTTCLSFDDTPCLVHRERDEVMEAIQRFKEFVDKVLELHQISPSKKFSLTCRAIYDSSDLDRWFSTAVQKGVEEVHFKLNGGIYRLPVSFFKCEMLVSLQLACFDYKKIQIPPSVLLPKLKILHLSRITFLDFNAMQRLFSSSELLEDLTLKWCECQTHSRAIYRTQMLKVLTIEECCFQFGTLEIDAPNLAYLNYRSNIGVKITPSWKYSCTFVKAELTFKCTVDDDFDMNENSVEYYCELLMDAAYNVTKLCFEMDAAKMLLKLGEDEQMPEFHSLLTLRISDCPYHSWKYVTSLLDKSPQLETVIFELGFHCCHCSRNRLYSDRCFCGTPSPSEICQESLVPFSCNARVIEVHDLCKHNVMLSLTGHLLRNASVLKKLTVFTKCNFDLEEERTIVNALLKLPRASTDCCLEINKGEGNILANFCCVSYVESPPLLHLWCEEESTDFRHFD